MPHLPMTAALREAADAGPFFALRRSAPAGPGGPREEGYVPLGEVHAPDGQVSAVLRRRAATVAASLRTDEPRVAASLAFQGLAARLWSVALGPAALTGQVPELPPDGLWWNPDRPAPDDLWLPHPRQAPPAPDGTAGQLRAVVLETHLVPLHRATGELCRISERLLWDNAASALAGSLSVLRDWCRARGGPEAAQLALALVRAQFAAPPLAGVGTWHDPGPRFRRTGCCLYYRVPGGGMCGDCALRPDGR